MTLGLKHIRDGGSFTLIGGLLNDDPIREGVSAALVNGGIEGFVRGAAIVLPRGLRINVCQPDGGRGIVAVGYGPYFRGDKAVPASKATLGYAKSVEGAQTGRVYRIGWFTRSLKNDVAELADLDRCFRHRSEPTGHPSGEPC